MQNLVEEQSTKLEFPFGGLKRKSENLIHPFWWLEK